MSISDGATLYTYIDSAPLSCVGHYFLPPFGGQYYLPGTASARALILAPKIDSGRHLSFWSNLQIYIAFRHPESL